MVTPRSLKEIFYESSIVLGGKIGWNVQRCRVFLKLNYITKKLPLILSHLQYPDWWCPFSTNIHLMSFPFLFTLFLRKVYVLDLKILKYLKGWNNDILSPPLSSCSISNCSNTGLYILNGWIFFCLYGVETGLCCHQPMRKHVHAQEGSTKRFSYW